MPMYWAVPSEPPSRASPDCFTPPKGAAELEMTPALKHTMPNFDLLCNAQETGEVPAVKVGGQTVFAGVAQPDGVFLRAERGDRGDGSKDFLT